VRGGGPGERGRAALAVEAGPVRVDPAPDGGAELEGTLEELEDIPAYVQSKTEQSDGMGDVHVERHRREDAALLEAAQAEQREGGRVPERAGQSGSGRRQSTMSDPTKMAR